MRTLLLALALLVACDDADPQAVVDAGRPDAAPVDASAADAASRDATPADAAPPDAAPADAAPRDAAPPDAFIPDAFVGPQDDTLRLHHVQARGTHNSYHMRPQMVFHPSHDYSHAPLDVQVGDQGVRQLELDLHARIQSGFDVFHLPLIDPETVCYAFEDCLRTLDRWSRTHPGHLPIVVWIEPKDEGSAPVNGHVPSVDRMSELDAAILGILSRDQVFTPDDLRGAQASVRDAVLADGWPPLAAVRGRFIFALLDTGAHRAAYVGEATDLAGRLLFVDADGPDDPRAALLKINDGTSDAARAAVAAGFLVTSNVDAADDPPEDRAARRAATLANGVHFLSSDRPAPASPDDTDWLDIPGGTPARCNPVTAPAGCTAAALEDL
ncbi:MAG: Ca2+-dependent phosphoinositide-specific phospholipase C [bacterium]